MNWWKTANNHMKETAPPSGKSAAQFSRRSIQSGGVNKYGIADVKSRRAWEKAQTGQPITLSLWHSPSGSRESGLTEATEKELQRDTLLGKGWYGSRDRDIAEIYGTPEQFSVELKNPYVIETPDKFALKRFTNEQLQEIREAGHDGIVVKAGTAKYDTDRSHLQVVAFNMSNVQKVNAGGQPKTLFQSVSPPGTQRATRLTVNGKGLLNNQVLDYAKLTDDEEAEVVQLLNYGLEQPRGVDSKAQFYFTDEGMKTNARLIQLLRKAAKGPVEEVVVNAPQKPLWSSSDGQIAALASDVTAASKEEYRGEHGAPEKKGASADDLTRAGAAQHKMANNHTEKYRGSHRAPGRDGARADDMTMNGVYPADVYTKPEWYESGEGLKEMYKIMRLRGHPDAPVWIFRSVPRSVAGPLEGRSSRMITSGDWVSTSKEYAKEHGDSALGGDYIIASRRVRAGEIYTEGNSIFEWGYIP